MSKVKDTEVDQKFEYEEDFSGPIDERKCRDIFWLILFCAFWIGMIVVASIGFSRGEPKRLYYPTDWKGSICGYDMTNLVEELKEKNANLTDVIDWDAQFPDLSEKTRVFFPATDIEKEFCVKECPTEGEVVDFCGDDDPKFESYQDKKEYCKYNSTSYVRRCFPVFSSGDKSDDEEKTEEQVSKSWSSTGKLAQAMGDVVQAWYVILVSAFVAFVLSFVWLWLLKQFAGFMVWFTVVAFFFVLGGITFFFYLQYQKSNEKYESDTSIEGSKTNSRVFLAFTFVGIGIFVITFCLIIFLRKKINLVIQIIKEAAKAIQASKFVVFFPIATFIALLCLYAWWVPVAIFMMAAGSPTLELDEIDGEEFYKLDYENDKSTNYATIYHFFGLLWTNAWIIGITQITIAGTIAQWYWTRDKDNIPGNPVLSAFKRTLKYHLGSAALGSFILAVIQFIRFCLEYIDRRSKKLAGESRWIRYLMCMAKYCVRLLESWIKFINRNAYIMIAVYGQSFCKSTKRAFHLISRNIGKLILVNVIGDFLLFLGKIIVAACTMIIALAMCMSNDDMTFYVLPAVLCGLLAYLIASAFMGVFEMCIDTILLCFCEDCERHDGSDPEKEPYATPELARFMSTHDQTEKMGKPIGSGKTKDVGSGSDGSEQDKVQVSDSGSSSD
ncbi:choline transporter-like (slc family 44) [Anaeramoeba flamelloides]|uniref:Choline transporter-like protein n=1 Tax=Anaeramoeba flamelloides TaxID=1746091 RepID=A0AAV8A176_9EUKA|nr:choline transporter-like (slc family 44) [Anaeramoeba flamelloides]